MKIRFLVDERGDTASGIRSFTDEITIEVDSGDPGGEPGEFAEWMRESLVEWFDGAKVITQDNQKGAS